MKRLLLLIAILCPLQGVMAESELFRTFSNPEMKYRPQVRWWWNGDKVTAHEILRELDVMKAAGIGGVEINPIAFPGGDSIGLRTLEWCSPEWCQMVKTAVDGCRERGMVCDMIVGSGWPFGSEPHSQRSPSHGPSSDACRSGKEHHFSSVPDGCAPLLPRTGSVPCPCFLCGTS